MRTFEISSRGKILGETDLETHDAGMNVRSGVFRPREEYFGVRSIFKVYAAAMDVTGVAQQNALAEYYRLRDELKLTVWERGGGEVPSGAIHIVDFDDATDELQIEVYPP